MTSHIYSLFGFSNSSSFKKGMNLKMTGGNSMFSPPSTIGRRLHYSFNIGNRAMMMAPNANGTMPGGNPYP